MRSHIKLYNKSNLYAQIGKKLVEKKFFINNRSLKSKCVYLLIVKQKASKYYKELFYYLSSYIRLKPLLS